MVIAIPPSLPLTAQRQPQAHTTTPKRETIVSMCGVCSEGCGVEVHLLDGKIDRLLYPQRRMGDKGAGYFERITWEDAYYTQRMPRPVALWMAMKWRL